MCFKFLPQGNSDRDLKCSIKEDPRCPLALQEHNITHNMLITYFFFIRLYFAHYYEREFHHSDKNIFLHDLPYNNILLSYLTYYYNVSSTNSEQCQLCINGPLYIDARLLWKQAIGSNCS